MAISSENSVKLPEKSSFSLTCNLLSRYLKERGSFEDLSIGMSGNDKPNGLPEMLRWPAATTMNFFPMIDNSGDVSPQNMLAPRRESMNLFPQQAGFAPNIVDPSLSKPAAAAAMEPPKAQMTIFYGGHVIVFDDIPADKANEIMQFASKGSSQSQSYNSFPANLSKIPTESSPPFTHTLLKNPTVTNSVTNFSNNMIPGQAQQPPLRAVACDLPIARRNSLHRFLEKRKDRVVLRSPYQVSSSVEAPNKPTDNNTSWLGLAPQT